MHGVGGTLGAVLTGVFATRAVCDVGTAASRWACSKAAAAEGPDHRHGRHLGLRRRVSFILLKVLDATMGLRVSQQDEMEGLDFSQHGEEGYIFI